MAMKNQLAGVLLVVLSMTANAASLVCSGTVEKIGIVSPGTLVVQFSGMNVPIMVCSTDAEWIVSGTTYTTNPVGCQKISDMLMTAKIAGTTFSAVYFEGDDVPSDCMQWGAWTSANLNYFEIQE